MAGFDNVGLSMLSVFQAMTLTNWSFTMFRTMDFLSPALVLYWLLLIVFGAFFVVCRTKQRLQAAGCTRAAAARLHACMLTC